MRPSRPEARNAAHCSYGNARSRSRSAAPMRNSSRSRSATRTGSCRSMPGSGALRLAVLVVLLSVVVTITSFLIAQGDLVRSWRARRAGRSGRGAGQVAGPVRGPGGRFRVPGGFPLSERGVAAAPEHERGRVIVARLPLPDPAHDDLVVTPIE